MPSEVRNRQFRRILVSTLLISILTLGGCNTLSSGRHYVLAKADGSRRLVEPKTILLPETEVERLQWKNTRGLLDEVNPSGNIGVILNGGFLRYLESVERPEVAIFCRARIRPVNEADETLLWEKVYLNSELENEHMVMNKDTRLSRLDIPILPPIVYEGQDIFISLRVVEMDREDNAAAVQLVQTAAAAGAQFRPEAATGITVAQAALTFLIQNNADDIEFQFDFALSESGTGMNLWENNTKFDAVMQPRVGTYAVIKTEHPKRWNIPSDYPTLLAEGVRYAGATIVRIATLNIFANSNTWSNDSGSYVDPDEDNYLKFFGNPLTIDWAAWTPPIFSDKRLISNAWADYEFGLESNDLVMLPTVENQEKEWFRDQGFLIFSVVPAKNGVDVRMLQEQASQNKVIEKLELKTGRLSTEDRTELLGAITNSISALATERRLRDEFLSMLANAETTTQALQVMEDFNTQFPPPNNADGTPLARNEMATEQLSIEAMRGFLKERVAKRVDILAVEAKKKAKREAEKKAEKETASEDGSASEEETRDTDSVLPAVPSVRGSGRQPPA